MDTWVLLIWVLVRVTASDNTDVMTINRIIEVLQRRHFGNKNPNILGAPRYPEDLPPAESILPGHTLIRPSMTMLKSAAKFPHRDVNNAAVYGNLDNLGITYGGTNERVLYTDFRKANDLLGTIIQAIQKINKSNGKNNTPIVIAVRKRPPLMGTESFNGVFNDILSNNIQQTSEEENNAGEVLDDMSNNSEESKGKINFRRASKRSRYRDRDRSYESSSESMTSDSADYEKNPGNPFTVHKNRYKQNWMWNFAMDGDHMNVNPYAPLFKDLGPTGADLFYGRKWWYFNQDDYVPFGKK